MNSQPPCGRTEIVDGPEFEQLVSFFEQIGRNLSNAELAGRIWILERRLGTPNERPADLAEARAMAHNLCNRRTAELMRLG